MFVDESDHCCLRENVLHVDFVRIVTIMNGNSMNCAILEQLKSLIQIGGVEKRIHRIAL
jgi:hypothetical protein